MRLKVWWANVGSKQVEPLLTIQTESCDPVLFAQH